MAPTSEPPDRHLVNRAVLALVELALQVSAPDGNAPVWSAVNRILKTVNGALRGPLQDHAMAASVGLMNDLAELFEHMRRREKYRLSVGPREEEKLLGYFVFLVERWSPPLASKRITPKLFPTREEIGQANGPVRCAAKIAAELYDCDERTMFDRQMKAGRRIKVSGAGHPRHAQALVARFLEAAGWRRGLAEWLALTTTTLGVLVSTADDAKRVELSRKLAALLHDEFPEAARDDFFAIIAVHDRMLDQVYGPIDYAQVGSYPEPDDSCETDPPHPF